MSNVLTRRILQDLIDRVNVLIENHRIKQPDSEESTALHDAMEQATDHLANAPQLTGYAVNEYGATVEGTSVSVHLLKDQLDAADKLKVELRALVDQNVALGTRAECAVNEQERLRNRNRILEGDVAMLRGYVQRMIDERRPPEVRLPSLESGRPDCSGNYASMANLLDSRPYR